MFRKKDPPAQDEHWIARSQIVSTLANAFYARLDQALEASATSPGRSVNCAGASTLSPKRAAAPASTRWSTSRCSWSAFSRT